MKSKQPALKSKASSFSLLCHHDTHSMLRQELPPWSLKGLQRLLGVQLESKLTTLLSSLAPICQTDKGKLCFALFGGGEKARELKIRLL